jgi:hypothetical protein
LSSCRLRCRCCCRRLRIVLFCCLSKPPCSSLGFIQYFVRRGVRCYLWLQWPRKPHVPGTSWLPRPLFSLAERRALRGVGPALTNTGTPAVAAVAPVGRPAITSSSSMRKVGALGGAASASAGSALPVPRSATASLPPRSDRPVIKRASARGSNDLEGECIDGDGSLIDDVYQDLKAACGKGVWSSHLATGPSHHYHLVSYDTNWAKRGRFERSLWWCHPFKSFGFATALLDDHVAALKPFFGTLFMIP